MWIAEKLVNACIFRVVGLSFLMCLATQERLFGTFRLRLVRTVCWLSVLGGKECVLSWQARYPHCRKVVALYRDVHHALSANPSVAESVSHAQAGARCTMTSRMPALEHDLLADSLTAKSRVEHHAHDANYFLNAEQFKRIEYYSEVCQTPVS